VSPERRRRLLTVAGIAAAIFVSLQLIRPELPNGRVKREIPAPEPVRQVLQASCYNCHSNETQLPWYDRIVPVYWMVAADVKKGRRILNFSELTDGQLRGALFESVSQMEAGLMPLKRYAAVHPESRTTPEKIAVLKEYLKTGKSAPASAEQEAAATREAEEWRRGKAWHGAVAAAPNGIEFIPDYRNWLALSVTDRFDNNTLRLVLGNDVAITAAHNHQTNPWPDGTTFAKVAWESLDDGTGKIHPGKFVQVEFMIKGAKKYKATKGWGWGRWKGVELKPYGSSPDFAEECIGCHTPMRDRDYVFTLPLQTMGRPSLPQLEWNPISMLVDRREGTMSLLYGNDAARALLTWKQRDDPHWFGARIPGEAVRIDRSASNHGLPTLVMP
jgi:hypothetical protein